MGDDGVEGSIEARRPARPVARSSPTICPLPGLDGTGKILWLSHNACSLASGFEVYDRTGEPLVRRARKIDIRARNDCALKRDQSLFVGMVSSSQVRSRSTLQLTYVFRASRLDKGGEKERPIVRRLRISCCATCDRTTLHDMSA